MRLFTEEDWSLSPDVVGRDGRAGLTALLRAAPADFSDVYVSGALPQKADRLCGSSTRAGRHLDVDGAVRIDSHAATRRGELAEPEPFAMKIARPWSTKEPPNPGVAAAEVDQLPQALAVEQEQLEYADAEPQVDGLLARKVDQGRSGGARDGELRHDARAPGLRDDP